jgi:hypothetical protein
MVVYVKEGDYFGRVLTLAYRKSVMRHAINDMEHVVCQRKVHDIGEYVPLVY